MFAKKLFFMDFFFSDSVGSKSTLRLSGLFLRRTPDREFHSYIPLLDYNPSDYEVLLRFWGSEPFPRHLGAFSGPMIAGEDPEETLLSKSSQWTNDLASTLHIHNATAVEWQKFVMALGGTQVLLAMCHSLQNY